MGVMHNPESEYSKEMARWDTPRRAGGMRPDSFEPFPQMLYRALENPKRNGKVMCGDPLVAVGDTDAESFTAQCQRTVMDEYERDRAIKEGWSLTPDAALQAWHAKQDGVARAAAEEAFRVNRMVNDKAKQEFHQAQEQADGYEHVPDPPAPKKAPKGTRVALAEN
jgi:hypothetical protein